MNFAGLFENQNVGKLERVGSIAAATILGILGFKARGLKRVLFISTAGGLLKRGISGKCELYDSLKINSLHPALIDKDGILVHEEIQIAMPREKLFKFWHNVENLPSVMSHLKEVKLIDDKRSHWVAKSIVGTTVEWDAITTVDRVGEKLDWRSVPGSSVELSGSVVFWKVGEDQTLLKVDMHYLPPAGRLGAAVARLFHVDAATEIRSDLQQFKAAVESGQVIT
ncbi:MAG: SRPBCC family protein [Verrucomicrobiota bacterium]|nr:SRPBCC family protein [Verrucomicrobiota bacterium]